MSYAGNFELIMAVMLLKIQRLEIRPILCKVFKHEPPRINLGPVFSFYSIACSNKSLFHGLRWSGTTGLKLNSSFHRRFSHLSSRRTLRHALQQRTLCISQICFQKYPPYRSRAQRSNTDPVLYICSLVIFMIGVSYASVPLYRLFCQATGIGGDPKLGHKTEAVTTMMPVRDRPVTVIFNADRHAAMQWNFKPAQDRVTVVPGETALAFYTAKNPTKQPIVGIATYNVLPFRAGLYFNKIQCFCFEEQWLNPDEEVDMPVFFYIDPEFDNDPQLAVVDEVVLSYTFFKAEEGQTLPMPGFMTSKFTNLKTAQ